MAERIVFMHAAHRSGKEATVFFRVQQLAANAGSRFSAMLSGLDEWLKKVLA